jgi:hypothetical protein
VSWRRILALGHHAADAAAVHDRQAWFVALRHEAQEYLTRNEVPHARLHDVPAWYVYPHLSVWAAESGASPGYVGWWVLCGDCPTDFAPCTGDRTPRAAVEEIAARWRAAAIFLAQGDQHPDFDVGDIAIATSRAVELAPLLAERARVLEKYLADEDIWN